MANGGWSMSKLAQRLNRTLAAGLIATALGACAATPPPADFEAGYRAYQRSDFQAALAIWRPLAESGHALAQYNLGLMHAEGRGLAQNRNLAVAWLGKAAAQGVPEAAFNLAGLRLAGAKPDYQAARRLLQAAAEAGLARAQHSLAKLYEYGLGGPSDDERAFHHFSLAAAQGHLGAMYNLGKVYRDGRGVTADEATSIKWFRAAGEAGYAKGQAKLGDRYAKGRGVPLDDLRAFFWTTLAARQGLPSAVEKLPGRKAKLTVEQLREAERRLGDFKPETGPTRKTE
jgi:TPR repeat protein